jgi:septal ring factor EnvC (AmiA/AmiB activator)
VTINDEMAKAYEAALTELDHLRRVSKLKDAELDAYKKQLEAQESYVQTLEAIVDKQKKLVGEQDVVTKLDEKVFNEFKQTISDLRGELERVRKSRDKYRGLVKVAAGIGLIIGIGLGYVLGNK